MRVWLGGLLGLALSLLALPCAAQSARELLTQASFVDKDKAVALRRIGDAERAAAAALRAQPTDGEARLMQAMAIGYRAKLTGSRGAAIAAREQFEQIVARFPTMADAQLALGAWHVGAINRLGTFVGRTALGARRPVGYAALDRAVALGGNRAFFPGLAALLRLQGDPADPRGQALAEAAVRAQAPTPLDRILQRASAAVLASVRSGNLAAAKALANRLLPFGQLPGES